LAVSDDRSLTVWDIERRRIVFEREDPDVVKRVEFSPDGDVIAAGHADGTTRLWARDGRLLHVLVGHPIAVTDLRFDPSGTRLVTTSEGSNRNAMVWDVATGRRLHDLVGHFGTVRAGSFSFDGRWIVTAGPISAVIWNAETGRLLFYLRGHTDLLTSASFSPRGYTVLTSARDGTVRTYECEVCVGLDGLVTLARQRLREAR
jgi:WD40 repeat protein